MQVTLVSAYALNGPASRSLAHGRTLQPVNVEPSGQSVQYLGERIGGIVQSSPGFSPSKLTGGRLLQRGMVGSSGRLLLLMYPVTSPRQVRYGTLSSLHPTTPITTTTTPTRI
jgi:hypothetical protein